MSELPPSKTGPINALADNSSNAGFLYAASAFSIWGIFPFLMKAVAHIDTIEVVAHRVIWSIPVAIAVIFLTGKYSNLISVFKNPRDLAMMALSAVIITINWSVYVWSIAAERAIEAALGYYINPLFTVVLGVTLLGEKLNRSQAIAIALAVVAVSILTIATGVLPWVALVLAVSFGLYGFLRKTVDVGPTQGFMVEISILSLFAIPYAIWLGSTGQANFSVNSTDTLLLLACGPATAAPLILFAYGAKRLRLVSIGLMQYIVPTMIFLIGVFVFREPFDQWQLIAFLLIWIAIIIYTWSSIKEARNS